MAGENSSTFWLHGYPGLGESVPSVYIVIDGLDELERSEWRRFFDTFNSVIEAIHFKGAYGHLFKLLVTSRTESEIGDSLTSAWNCDLGATDHTAMDVAEYIKGTITDFGLKINFGDENITEIISEITKKAEGMFLWATLAWSLFTDGVGMWTRSLVQQKIEGLRQVPSGIESLYHRILSLVDKRIASDLLATLKWIVATAEPLTIDEIAVALSLRARHRRLGQLEIPFNMQAFLKKTCPHLIRIDESGVIKLVHLSFKTFLLETKFIKLGSDSVQNPFWFDLKPVNYEIGLDCLSYMTLEDFSGETLEKVQQRVFFPYCHKNWIYHLRYLTHGFGNIYVYFFKLLNFETMKLRWYDTSKMIFQLWNSGLSKLFEPAVRLGMDLNVFDGKGDHLIHHICSGPNGISVDAETLKWLVGLGVDINGRTLMGQTLLHKCLMIWHDALCHPDMDDSDDSDFLARTLGHVSITSKKPFEIALDLAKDTCRELLSHPTININAKDEFRHSPLSYAIYWGMTDAMNTLLACPYLRAEKGHSALHIAAKEGLFDAVKQLLERGADVHERDWQGQTVLHLAAAGGHFRIMQLLVANADAELLNAKDRRIDPKDPYADRHPGIRPNGWAPLHLAVTSGHDELVLWLINHPWIDLYVRDKHGRRLIAFAAAFGTKTMLKAFLAQDLAQITHKDLFGNGLLQMASLGSNLENFDFLFSLDVTPRTDPNKWGNTIVDLAPNLAVDQHLHKLGFVHSKARKYGCLVALDRDRENKRCTIYVRQSSPPRQHQWLTIMLVPDRDDPALWEYSLNSIKGTFSRRPQNDVDRQYALRNTEAILERLPLFAFDNKRIFLKDLLKKLSDRPEINYDYGDDLQRLQASFDCILELSIPQRDEWEKLRDFLRHF